METAFSLDQARLDELTRTCGERFRTAAPFPHVVIDDLLAPDVLDRVLTEFPTPDQPDWLRFDSDTERKLATTGHRHLGPATRGLLAELNGATTIDFLTDLTGIDGLVPDPHFVGGGLHQIERGGHLDVHADFNVHPLTGLCRRLNVIVYLNRDWDPAWGGALELWSDDMRRSVVEVEPVFNRCVVFATSDRSFHGHPRPLTCPDGVTRKSLALYYYVRGSDPDEPHNTVFRQRRGWLRRAGDELLPPAAARGLRRLARRTRDDA